MVQKQRAARCSRSLRPPRFACLHCALMAAAAIAGTAAMSQRSAKSDTASRSSVPMPHPRSTWLSCCRRCSCLPCMKAVSEKRKGTCSRVIAYLLQLVQRALSDTTLLEIVLRRIHHLLDDLLVDIALFLDISYCNLAYPDRRRGRSQHTTSAFVIAND